MIERSKWASKTEEGGKIEIKKLNRLQEAKNVLTINLPSIFIISESYKPVGSLYTHTHIQIYYLLSYADQL